MTRIGPHKASCDGCGLTLTLSQTHYLAVSGGWVQRRRMGGPHGIVLAVYTGRVLCAMCLDDEYLPCSTVAPRANVCQGCHKIAPDHFLELESGFVKRRGAGANAVTHHAYTGRVLCRTCLLDAERGEQLGLGL